MSEEQAQIGMDEVELEELDEQSQEYDLGKLSDRKIGDKYETPNLDGQETAIKQVSLAFATETTKTQNGKEVLRGRIVVHYDHETGARANYGGLVRFKREGAWSHPACDWEKGQNAAAKLMRAYCEKARLPLGETNLKELCAWLTGKRVKLAYTVASYGGKEFGKNVIADFLD